MQRRDDITPGRAALRDFKPAYFRSGSKAVSCLTDRMSALPSCGQTVAYALARCVPILLQKSEIAWR
jgi:hypothetical protein